MAVQEREDEIKKQSSSTSLYSYRAPSGKRFEPTDEELVVFYLSNRIAGVKRFRYEPSVIIPTVDLYGPSSEPWRVCEEVAFPYSFHSTEFFCFTTRKQLHSRGDRCDRRVGCGTWSKTGKDKEIWGGGVLLGHRSFFSFKVLPPGITGPIDKKDMVTTHWVMYEYRMERPEFQTMVICKIRNKKKEDDIKSRQWSTPWWETSYPCNNNRKTKTPSSSGQSDEEGNRGSEKKGGTVLMSESLGSSQKRLVVEVGSVTVWEDPQDQRGGVDQVIIERRSNSETTSNMDLITYALEKEICGSTMIKSPVCNNTSPDLLWHPGRQRQDEQRCTTLLIESSPVPDEDMVTYESLFGDDEREDEDLGCGTTQLATTTSVELEPLEDVLPFLELIDESFFQSSPVPDEKEDEDLCCSTTQLATTICVEVEPSKDVLPFLEPADESFFDECLYSNGGGEAEGTLSLDEIQHLEDPSPSEVPSCDTFSPHCHWEGQHCSTEESSTTGQRIMSSQMPNYECPPISEEKTCLFSWPPIPKLPCNALLSAALSRYSV